MSLKIKYIFTWADVLATTNKNLSWTYLQVAYNLQTQENTFFLYCKKQNKIINTGFILFYQTFYENNVSDDISVLYYIFLL